MNTSTKQRSWGWVSTTVTVPIIIDGCQPCNQVVLAKWIRRTGQLPSGRIANSSFQAFIFSAADAIEAATGDSVNLKVDLSAEDTDTVRLQADKLWKRALEPPQGVTDAEFYEYRDAAYALKFFYRAWTQGTGWDYGKQAMDSTTGIVSLGSGYRK